MMMMNKTADSHINWLLIFAIAIVAMIIYLIFAKDAIGVISSPLGMI